MEKVSTTISALAREMGIKLEQFGSGRPLLILHGGGGLATLGNYALSLADKFNVILPTHPGFDGTVRPDHISSVKDLAKLYTDLMIAAKLQNVLVMGFSIGGWIAAEMATLLPTGLAGLILVDAGGLTVPGESALDIFSIAPGQIADYSFYQPDKFRIDVAALSPERRVAMQANFATLAVYGRAVNMQDPDLASRLTVVEKPSLIVWGESDRVVTPNYGRAFAKALPNSRFELIAECGHLPQLEQPTMLTEKLVSFSEQLSIS